MSEKSLRKKEELEVEPLTQPNEKTIATTRPKIFEVTNLNVYYSDFRAIRDVSLNVAANEITAFIGPSGCGKTTMLRSFNRMNDLIPTAKITGTLLYRGADLYNKTVDPVEVRRRIGMVFQKPNPFPKSIYDNVAYGPRISGKLHFGKKSKIDLNHQLWECLVGNSNAFVSPVLLQRTQMLF